jgi:hypothetical protein
MEFTFYVLKYGNFYYRDAAKSTPENPKRMGIFNQLEPKTASKFGFRTFAEEEAPFLARRLGIKTGQIEVVPYMEDVTDPAKVEFYIGMLSRGKT